MNPAIPTDLLREAFAVLMTSSWPIFAALLAGGAAVGFFQAATQINDPAVGFVPRLLLGLGAVWGFGATMMQQLASFLENAILRMSGS